MAKRGKPSSKHKPLRKEENAFREVKPDNGRPLAYFYYLVREFPSTANVVRIGVNESEQDLKDHLYTNASVGGQKTNFRPSDKTSAAIAISRSIHGDLVFNNSHPRTWGFISEKGTERFTGPLKFELREGSEEHSQSWYWGDDPYGEPTIHFSIYVAAERFEWIWRELILRPHGQLEISFSTRAYQHEADHHLSEPYHQQELFLEKDSRNPIREVSFTVRDSYPAPSTKASPREENSGDMLSVLTEPQITPSQASSC